MDMDWLLIATGFTGALTLVYHLRVILRWLNGTLELKVYFSPKGGCQEAIVRELKNARREILVQAYSFTADPITYSLVDAQKRGVNVEVLLDRANEKESYSDLRILIDQGLKPLIDAKHAIAHNKVMVIDQKVIITGSYNFTNQAESDNAENLIVVRHHPELVKYYRDNFILHKTHSQEPGQQPVEGQSQRRAA